MTATRRAAPGQVLRQPAEGARYGRRKGPGTAPPEDGVVQPARRAHVVTRTEFALLLGCTPDRVTKYAAEGMPIRTTGGGRGKVTTIELGAALPWLLKRRNGVLDEERSRYFKLQADRIALDIRHRAGELVEASDVDARWADMVVATRERLLAVPAVALQRKLIASDAEEALVGLVDDALRELVERGADERA